MTWLDRIKRARKLFYAEWNDAKESKYHDEEDAAMFRALILTTEAIEEIGRQTKARTTITSRNSEAFKSMPGLTRIA
jgi:hypothetical protein